MAPPAPWQGDGGAVAGQMRPQRLGQRAPPLIAQGMHAARTERQQRAEKGPPPLNHPQARITDPLMTEQRLLQLRQ